MSAVFAFWVILVLVGGVSVIFGLVTGDMPPFPNKYRARWQWAVASRSEEPVQYWTSVMMYVIVALYGGYLIATHGT